MNATAKTFQEIFGAAKEGLKNNYHSNGIIKKAFGSIDDYTVRREGGESSLTAAFKSATRDANDNLSFARIAGSYMGLSAGYRLASGGGLYKDKDGNVDVIGMPLI